MADPVIEEIHQTRRAISDRFNGDIGAIAADAAARQSSSGHPVWKPEAPNKRATSDRGLGGRRYTPRPPPPRRGGGSGVFKTSAGVECPPRPLSPGPPPGVAAGALVRLLHATR
jgi:hypothetical protein